MKILFISSRPPQYSAGLADDMINALTLAGYQVDFLTSYDFEGRKKNQYYVYKKPSKFIVWKNRLLRIPDVIRFGKSSLFGRVVKNGMIITNMAENRPPINVRKILAKISKQYNLVVTLFWDGMLTTYSLKCIQDKLRCPVIILSVDMFTFTGGCFYFGNCRNFEHECGCCPILKGNNPKDVTYRNFMFKRKMYGAMNYAIGLNTWMKQFAIKTKLFEERRIVKTCAIIDEEKFKPQDTFVARSRFGISEMKKFVLFARYSNLADEERKGYKYLSEALNLFYEMLTKEEQNEIVLLLAGNELSAENCDIKFEFVNVGYLSTEDLILAYSASNAFLSPSIDDAGPSMVNQSIMCGTPVIAFNIGTAIDVIEKGISGWCVETKNTKEYANAIYELFRMKHSDYQKLRESSRERAMATSSKSSFVKMIEETYILLK